MKFRGKRALRAAFPGDTSIVQVRIITKQDGEIDVEGPVSEDEATAIFKLAAGSPSDTRAEEAAVVEAAMAWEHWANLPASECTPAAFRNLRLAGDTLAATLRLRLSRCRPAHGIESRLATTESTFRCASTAAANCAALRAKRGG